MHKLETTCWRTEFLVAADYKFHVNYQYTFYFQFTQLFLKLLKFCNKYKTYCELCVKFTHFLPYNILVLLWETCYNNFYQQIRRSNILLNSKICEFFMEIKLLIERTQIDMSPNLSILNCNLIQDWQTEVCTYTVYFCKGWWE